MITGRDDIGSRAACSYTRRPITRRITTVNIRARIITVIRYAGAGCARRDLPFALLPAPRPHNPVHASVFPRVLAAGHAADVCRHGGCAYTRGGRRAERPPRLRDLSRCRCPMADRPRILISATSLSIALGVAPRPQASLGLNFSPRLSRGKPVVVVTSIATEKSRPDNFARPHRMQPDDR